MPKMCWKLRKWSSQVAGLKLRTSAKIAIAEFRSGGYGATFLWKVAELWLRMCFLQSAELRLRAQKNLSVSTSDKYIHSSHLSGSVYTSMRLLPLFFPSPQSNLSVSLVHTQEYFLISLRIYLRRFSNLNVDLPLLILPQMFTSLYTALKSVKTVERGVKPCWDLTYCICSCQPSMQLFSQKSAVYICNRKSNRTVTYRKLVVILATFLQQQVMTGQCHRWHCPWLKINLLSVKTLFTP